MTLEELKARCEIEDGHWIWTGATSAGGPNIWAPDYTRKDGKCCNQRGPRAVWHLKTKKPIPDGFRVFKTCKEVLCINPAHVECIPCAEWGAKKAASDDWKGNMKRIAANRRSARARSKLTPEKVVEILTSPKSGLQLAREMNTCRTSISRLRTGKASAFTPVGGLFTGLIAFNDSGRDAA